MGWGGVSTEQYRSAIGRWCAMAGGGRRRLCYQFARSRPRAGSFLLTVLYLFLLVRAACLLRHGDVKPNPGPSSSPSSSSCSGTQASSCKAKSWPEVSTSAHAQLSRLAAPIQDQSTPGAKCSRQLASTERPQPCQQATRLRTNDPRVSPPSARHRRRDGDLVGQPSA